MARVRCFFFLSVFIRYMRFDSLGSPSGRKVFERDPRASRFRDSGKEKFREFSRIEHFWNRFFRKVSFDWGLWDWRCTGFSRIKYNSKGKIGVDIRRRVVVLNLGDNLEIPYYLRIIIVKKKECLMQLQKIALNISVTKAILNTEKL